MAAKRQSKVFISYSRADLAFTNELAAALEMSDDFEILIDRVGIGHGEAWRERLGRLIVECDTMVFVLSPDSVSSEVCAWEISEARRHAKRIIPVLWRAVDFDQVPKDLGAINAVPFNGEYAVSGLPKLLDALNSDLAWLREHTRMGERAVEWEQSGRTIAYLLRSDALTAARDWLAEIPTNAPAPTDLQRKFLQASEDEESRLLSDEHRRLKELEQMKTAAETERDAAEEARTKEARSARRVVRVTTTGLIVSFALFLAAAGASWFANQKAKDERKATIQAKEATTEAVEQRDNALLVRSRFLARAAQEYLTRGDAANAIGLARKALPVEFSNSKSPYSIEAVQVLFDAYGKLHESATLRGHTVGLDGALALPGERVITWGQDGMIRWWRNDGSLLKAELAHEHPTRPDSFEDTGVSGVLRLDDGRLLSWGVDKTARLWLDDGTFAEVFLREETWIQNIERLTDGRIAAQIGNEYRIWSKALEPLQVLQSPLKWLRGVKMLRDGRFLTWHSEPGKNTHNAMLWSTEGEPGSLLEGHENMIRDGFQLSDGHIVTLDNLASFRVWSAEGGLETVIDKAHKHLSQTGTIAFPLRDGRFYSWGQEAYNNNVWWGRLWNIQGKSIPLIEASDTPLEGLELEDGRLLLGINSRTPVIRGTDGSPGPGLRGHEEPAFGAVQWPDGRIATFGKDHTARLWNQEGEPLLTLSGHEAAITGIEQLADNRYLTWSYQDRTARIWGHEPQPRSQLQLEGGDAKDVQQLSNGLIAVLTSTSSVMLYGADLVRSATLSNDARGVLGLFETADGQLLTQGKNHTNRASGPALRLWSSTGEIIADLANQEVAFVHVAQTPQGRLLGFDQSGQVWVWGTDGKLAEKRKGIDTKRIYHIHPLKDGRFVTVGDENRLQLWSAEGEPGKVLKPQKLQQQIDLLDDGQIFMLSTNRLPQIWDEKTNRLLSLDLEEQRTNTATLLQGGKILLNQLDTSMIVVNADRTLRKIPQSMGENGEPQRHKIFKLRDGRLLVSTDNQGTMLWNADGKSEKKIMDRNISGALLLSDNSFLVWSNDGNNNLQIIHPEGDPGPVLYGHESEIIQAIQLVDGRILSWAEDATVRIWPGSVSQAVEWADEIQSRLQPLSPAELCHHYLKTPEPCEKLKVNFDE